MQSWLLALRRKHVDLTAKTNLDRPATSPVP
jgi:hypothetical protein